MNCVNGTCGCKDGVKYVSAERVVGGMRAECIDVSSGKMLFSNAYGSIGSKLYVNIEKYW